MGDDEEPQFVDDRPKLTDREAWRATELGVPADWMRSYKAVSRAIVAAQLGISLDGLAAIEKMAEEFKNSDAGQRVKRRW